MAIDDNTSYELTGAQVKDLASKIKAKADSSSLATVATTGNYNDLTNQPTIPTVNDATLTVQQNGTTVGTFTANASSNATISLTDTTYSAMTGATSGAAGTSGLVPAPAAGDQAKYLKGDGTWGTYDDPMIDEAACAIKPMSNAFAQEIADAYNDAHADPQDPSSYISSLNVKGAIPFMFVDQSGEPISTLSRVRNALKSSNRVVYNGTDDKFVSSHSSASGYAKFGLFDPLYSEVKNYKVRAGNSSDSPAFKQYLPYIIVPDEYGSQNAWGYTDGTESADSLIDTPETKYQVAHDANGNLYMASDATSVNDWKQISNVSVPTVNDGTLTIQQNGTTVGTFTANQSTNTTVNLAGGIYADDPTASANPDGWITPSDIDWSTFTYSTSEQRVGTWINGKPVYKKTVDTGALPNNTSKQVSHGISNLDIVVSLSGSAKGGTTQITLPYVDTTAASSVGAYVSGNYIRIFTSSNRSDFTTSYVTLYYTKTTD